MFTQFTGKHLCQSLFFKKEALAQEFSCDFVKFLRTPFLQNKSGRLFLNIVNSNLSLAENFQLEDIRIFIFDIYAKTGTGGVL